MKTQRELIASALRRLGPERCEQGLAAFVLSGAALDGPWSNCFLARCGGDVGVLFNRVRAQAGWGMWDAHAEAASLLGLALAEAQAVTFAFDDLSHASVWSPNSPPSSPCGEVGRDELRQMVEAEASKARVQQKPEPCHA